jgi:hypothetical protein
VQPQLDTTATTLSRGLSTRSWYCPPSRSDRTRSASKYFQAMVWPHMPSRPTGPKHAVVNLLGIAVLKTQDVDQPHEANPESVAIGISVRVFRALAVLLRFTNGISGATSLKDDNALLTKRQGPPAVNSVLEQQVRCVSHDRVCLTASTEPRRSRATAPPAPVLVRPPNRCPRELDTYRASTIGVRPTSKPTAPFPNMPPTVPTTAATAINMAGTTSASPGSGSLRRIVAKNKGM